MTNKHFCQGTNCHTYTTTDRFQKSKGIIRGRYAIYTRDNSSEYHARAKYFCSTRCENDWLNENMSAIEMGIPVAFITERRFTKGYEKKTTTYEGWNGGTYQTNSIERVDNNLE